MRTRRRRVGLSMVELAAIISVVGVLLAIVVPAFLRELRASKTSEGPIQLAALYRASAAYFAARHEVPAPPPVEEVREGEEEVGDAGPPPVPPPLSLTRCLPDPAGPTPRRPTMTAEHVDFAGEDEQGAATWAALAFQPDYPVRYSYTFEPTTPGCGLRSPEDTYLLTLRAEGDLDGDGERAIFERRAAAREGEGLTPFGILYTRDRVE